MRHLATGLGFAAMLLLTGCSGFWVFMDDTHNPTPHMNQPIGNSENMRRIQGHDVAVAPLTEESGNIWPGPPPPTPTLEDLARQPMTPVPPLEPSTPMPARSTVPELAVPPVPGHLQPRPDENFLNGPANAPLAPPAPPPPAAGGSSGLGVVVPNGNGTSTVIAPDGTITTIPTPPPNR